jgi:hypothetical protein
MVLEADLSSYVTQKGVFLVERRSIFSLHCCAVMCYAIIQQLTVMYEGALKSSRPNNEKINL